MPGLGLLLLRATLGITLLAQGITHLTSQNNPSILIWTLGLLTIAGGTLLLLGFLTPLFSVMAFLNGISHAFSLFPSNIQNSQESALAVIYLIIMAVALFLLGPGAYSLDARMFGRREIIIPHNPREPKS